jgi:hypothetical protein
MCPVCSRYPMLMYFHADKTMDPLYYEGPKYSTVQQ